MRRCRRRRTVRRRRWGVRRCRRRRTVRRRRWRIVWHGGRRIRRSGRWRIRRSGRWRVRRWGFRRCRRPRLRGRGARLRRRGRGMRGRRLGTVSLGWRPARRDGARTLQGVVATSVLSGWGNGCADADPRWRCGNADHADRVVVERGTDGHHRWREREPNVGATGVAPVVTDGPGVRHVDPDLGEQHSCHVLDAVGKIACGRGDPAYGAHGEGADRDECCGARTPARPGVGNLRLHPRAFATSDWNKPTASPSPASSASVAGALTAARTATSGS